jgi:hypothetical protein
MSAGTPFSSPVTRIFLRNCLLPLAASPPFAHVTRSELYVYSFVAVFRKNRGGRKGS